MLVAEQNTRQNSKCVMQCSHGCILRCSNACYKVVYNDKAIIAKRDSNQRNKASYQDVIIPERRLLMILETSSV